MDLDDFELTEQIPSSSEVTIQSAQAAVEYIDAEWYIYVNRRGRWMDLIGDYAGSEPFVVDGEALLQIVLDDPLLALARDDEPSFQIIHALHLLERILQDISQRSTSFEIVFWRVTRHRALQAGRSDYAFASRTLAHMMLLKHLQQLDIPVHTFEDLSDPRWFIYQSLTKPMFVMTNDGGILDESSNTVHAEYILTQRCFMFDLLSQGVSVTLLQGAEFRDSKIMSFVYEQRLDLDARKRLDNSLWAANRDVSRSLDATELQSRHSILAGLLMTSALQNPRDIPDPQQFVKHLVRNILASDISGLTFLNEMLFAFVAHCFLCPHLSIEERARPPISVHPDLKNTLLHTFLPRVFLVLESMSSGPTTIDLDGRVFAELLTFLSRRCGVTVGALIEPELYSQVEGVWNSLSLPDVDYGAFAGCFPPPPVDQNSSLTSAPPMSLLPFTHPVFDEELASVHVAIESGTPETPSSHLEFNTIFSDTQHWHNHRRAILPSHLGGDEQKPVDAKQRRRLLRSEQRFMSKLQWQAETLTGALGVPLQQMVIPSAATKRSKPSVNSGTSDSRESSRSSKPDKKGKKEHVSSADKIRQANAVKKQAKEDDSNVIWWQDHLKSMSAMSTAQKVAFVDNLMRSDRTKDGWLAVEIRLYRLHQEFVRWTEDAERETAHAQDHYTVTIMCMVKELYERKDLFHTAAKKLSSSLIAIGLSDYAPRSLAVSGDSSVADHLLHFDFIRLVKSKSGSPVYKYMPIVEDPILWQMRLFGEFMDRSMDSQRDPRVSFLPDAWQRKVLDCLDQNQSVLVAAPTSAGKTFISYYAMEQLLRNSDDDVLVYVAPTKALVSQIAAEVYARFKKELSGRACWAIHTRDYRVHNPQNCQILVTVPEMLAIMLLSPPLARVWTPKIKRIILDEIHTIGQQEGGAVWEQIILLAPCPIIGLSATIGEPEKFNSWLKSVQEAHGYKHAFIHHPHRYSHLRKFTYVLQEERPTRFDGLVWFQNTNRLRFLHPISMLAFGARTLPPDFSLEAADCLSLFQALQSSQGQLSFDVGALEPTRFFSSRATMLKQQDILRYESALKTELSRLIASSDPQDDSSILNTVIAKLTDPVVASVDQKYVPTAGDFFVNLIYLVSDLHCRDDLPALLFNFDRKACEKMGEALLAVLETAETRCRNTDPEWKRKITQWENWLAKAKDRERQAERLKKQKADQDAPHATEVEFSWEASFNPQDPSPQFSFAGTPRGYSKSDLEEEIQSLARWKSAPEWALKALRRGIGIHHSGMNKHYRALVESLYRAGYLRVVICTGTLALGINAPTRTSVFCGDSPFLTALMYRQCSGRAGRRGFDLLGKVVFYGLAMDRCQRLVLSKLPSLGGNFPLTSTMVLRLFNLLQGSDNAPVAKDAIHSLLRLPHVSFVSDVGRQQILHHIRFSIDYLRRSGLLDAEGNPINLFGIAAHLYYTEPSNMAMVALLRHGVVHRICNQASVIDAKRELLLLMCHLFGRRYLPKSYATAKHLKSLIKRSPSMVILPSLPDDAGRVLTEHNDHIRRVFASYALVYATQHLDELGQDARLPLSRKTYPTESGKCDSPFRSHLQSTAVKAVARSPFVANSGHGDDFKTVNELTSTARRGLHLNEYAIPSMQQFTAIPGQGNDFFALNAYLLDFYTHGQTAALKAANGIRDGEMWYLLQDFTLTLKTIRTGLAQLLQKASSNNDGMEADDGGELDSGYGTVDPAEADPDEGDSQSGVAFKRPVGVSDRDWKVYQVLDAVTEEFDEKFRAMWA